MTNRIIIHSTNTPQGQSLSLDDIEQLNSQNRHSDPMPYHYVINPDGSILKGKSDRELCGHCGRFSRDSISVAIVGGFIPSDPDNPDDPDCGEYSNTLDAVQEKSLRVLLRNLATRHPHAIITGANSLLFPDDDPTTNEPYFDVPKWLIINPIV